MRIVAGRIEDIKPEGNWAIVDIGFSKKATCALLLRGRLESSDEDLSFGELCKKLQQLVWPLKKLNLVIEAPLSYAFDEAGNPVGRNFEKPIEAQSNKESRAHRYWYLGAGACVTLAAARLLLILMLNASKSDCEVRLFEGFVSFKSKKRFHSKKTRRASSHIRDAKSLWIAIEKTQVSRKHKKMSPWAVGEKVNGRIEPALQMLGDTARSVPPVIWIPPRKGANKRPFFYSYPD